MKNELFQRIPAVNDILENKKCEKLIRKYNHELVLNSIRKVLNEKREIIAKTDIEKLKEKKVDLSIEPIIDQVKSHIIEYLKPTLEKVINATGTIVHTNLGRSLLSANAVQSLVNIANNYSTLEIDKKSGERGSRYKSVSQFLIELTKAESALVVNNNAAAVLLILDTFAKGKEVILSRGEMVEVGGSFRIPEVMEKSGAKLVEVGATNKAYIKDYESKINDNTGILLKVHTSNYKIMGFTEEVNLKELVELGEKYSLPVVEDLGSGIINDLSDLGLVDEPTVADKIKQGADLVSFSGDKLLGGPQAGIIVGKKVYINKLKINPLTRALRVDKFTLSTLESTLKSYIKKEEREEIPTLKMISEKSDLIKSKAKKLKEEVINLCNDKYLLSIEKETSKVGGGAFPMQGVPTYVLKLKTKEIDLNTLGYKLRMNTTPIFTRLHDGSMIFDLRTIKDEEILQIAKALKKAL